MKDDETPPTFADRAIQLKEAHKPLRETRYIDVVPVTTVDASEKYLVEEYIERAMNDGAEGIVVRPESHRRVNGRNPLAMKLKFTATADVVLSSAKGRSMEMHVTDAANKRLAIGRVTIPSNHALPASGSVAEVRYLYRAPGAPLQQPVFLRLRDDLTEADCLDGKITRYKDAPVLSKAYLGHAKSIAQRSGSNNLLW